MLEIDKSWSELKAILLSNNLYFDYDDSPDGLTRKVFCQRNAVTVYTHKMNLSVEPPAGSDQEDFDTNWAHKAGERKYVYYSQSFDVVLTNGQCTFDFKIKANDETTDVEAFLYKGSINVNSPAIRGDWVEVQVVDKDNLLGYGADTILGWVIRKWILAGGAENHEINPPKYDFLSSKRKIPAGIYLRVIYHGSGTPNVITCYEYEY